MARATINSPDVTPTSSPHISRHLLQEAQLEWSSLDLLNLVSLSQYSIHAGILYHPAAQNESIKVSTWKETTEGVLRSFWSRGLLQPEIHDISGEQLVNDVGWRLTENAARSLRNHDLELTSSIHSKIRSSHLDELLEIWRELARDELMAFLQYRLSQYNLPFRSGVKTENVLRLMLEGCSIGQCYNMVWVSVERAISYQKKSQVSDRQAANTVISICESRYRKASTENWELKNYGKPTALPRSARTELFAYTITTLGEDFFTAPIDEASLTPHLHQRNQ